MCQVVPSLLARADIALAENEQGLFEQHLATLVALWPEDSGVLRLRSSAARSQCNLSEATAFSKRAFKQAPGTGTLLELMENRSAAGHDIQVRTAMLEWVKEHPSDIVVCLALSDRLLIEKDFQGAQDQYREVRAEAEELLAALSG